MVRKSTASKWQKHTTKMALQIEGTLKRTHNSLVFRYDKWIVAVSLTHVRPAKQERGRV